LVCRGTGYSINFRRIKRISRNSRWKGLGWKGDVYQRLLDTLILSFTIDGIGLMARGTKGYLAIVSVLIDLATCNAILLLLSYERAIPIVAGFLEVDRV
jgi:hypothetical protein